MTKFRTLTLFGLLAAAPSVAASTPASATHGPIERRNAGLYRVSPAMMHAIDVIVAEKMKMMRRGR